MDTLGLYDSRLQMFIERPRDVDLRHLRFLRWLAEHGELEHEVFGPPSGSCSAAIPDGPGSSRPLAA